ncbi:hypothetical protein F5888DRAFT_159597 [Russula emetica]|nr:hypothetical protein F5888DRAFT_159597 [Russula emetica]
MLPFPIFLFLLISATLLAPPPHVLVGSFKIFTLRSFEWSSLPTTIPDPYPQSPPEDTALFSLGFPSVTLNPSPTQCCPNSMLVANNTAPYSFARATDDRTGCTAVLLIVSLAMLSCFVYRLLVDESDEFHDAERKSEQFTQSPLSNRAAPPQESMHHYIPTVEETPHPFSSVDTAKPVSESLEHGSLPYSTKSPSTLSFAITIPHQSPAPLGQSLLFPIISHRFSLDSSDKTTDDDSSPSTLPASGCALIDSPSVSATQIAAFEAPSALSVEPTVRIDDSGVGLPECTPLDTEAAKVTTLPLLDLSNILHPRKPEPSGELQDDSMSSPTIEDACELDADEQDVFFYQPSNSEGDDDETLDYKEVDNTPEAPKTPPAPAIEDRALPSPQLRLRSRGHSLDYASSFSAKKFASEVVNARLPSPRFSFLFDRTSEGQSEGEITSITRCASADNLVSTFETSNAAHGSHSSCIWLCSILTRSTSLYHLRPS